MTDKQLRKLSRKELLEILIAQAKDIENLQTEIDDLKKKSDDRKLKIAESGSIAEAALSLNGVFEAAQSAAEDYLVNVRDSEDYSAKIRADAEREAERIISEARKKAEALEAVSEETLNRYYCDITERLEKFYEEHKGLKEMIGADTLKK